MTGLIHPYYNRTEYQRLKNIAQVKASQLGVKLVFGYCSYAGWTHTETSDEFGIASLGDIELIQPTDPP